jgi:glucosamine-6-phosphate deaminase
MLGYQPHIVHLVRSPRNRHFFATLTSGFTAVTNAHLLGRLNDLHQMLVRHDQAWFFNWHACLRDKPTARNNDVELYLDGVAGANPEMRRAGEAGRMLRDISGLTGRSDLAGLKSGIRKIQKYLLSAYPGKKDPPPVQRLKGMIREWEEELLWAHLGFDGSHIHHLRLGFYTGDIFTPQPESRRDVKPVLDLIEKTRPDIITAALDPEASGPDTHYKVLQIIADALRIYLSRHPGRKVRIWGYRNVWHRFDPSQANIYVPVSMNTLNNMKATFNTCFASQRAASFPSPEHDGPFAELSQRILVDQYMAIQACLGRDFFYSNPLPRLRATRGLNFLREMAPREFFGEARALRRQAEGADRLKTIH